MYERNQGVFAASENIKADKAPALLPEFIERFEKANHVYSDTLNHIEEKLHLILNKRYSKGDAEVVKQQAVPDDAHTRMTGNLNYLNNNNDRLSQLLSHLSEII